MWCRGLNAWASLQPRPQTPVGVEFERVTNPATLETLPLGAHLSQARRRHLVTWLWLGAALTFSMLVVGGVTRLTQSGLSIVEWAPLVGVVPPLNEAQWLDAFAQYQRFPEYRQLRPDMTLGEYKTIYYWEYAHRLLARAIGVVFLLPFLLFWLRGYLNGPLARRLLVLFGLGALQGVMGWFMVASGLVDRPAVAHERLAAHLLLAFTIFAYCLWTANDLLARPREAARTPGLYGWLVTFGAVLVLQVTYGAFVAGLDAGKAFNTYPLMAGSFWPPAAWRLEPPLLNLLDNIATVQWIHRTLPLLLLGVAAGLLVAAVRRRAEPGGRLDVGWAAVLLSGVLIQGALGVATLLSAVALDLAATHQATALLLFGTWVLWLHRATRLRLAVRP